MFGQKYARLHVRSLSTKTADLHLDLIKYRDKRYYHFGFIDIGVVVSQLILIISLFVCVFVSNNLNSGQRRPC